MLSTATRRLSTSTALQRHRCLLKAAVSKVPAASATTIVLSRRQMSSDDELPYHLVVGMPALSPTMERGTLASWKIDEGGAFSAGDSLAEIETDKASIDFEAQDDGYIAKYLVSNGTEVEVGQPIMVTVEEEEYISAFKDFVPPEKSGGGDGPKEETKVETPPPAAAASAAPPTPPPAPAVETPPPTPPPPPVAPPAAAPAPPEAAPELAASGTAIPHSPSWGRFAANMSPIARTLSAAHKRYIDLYGSTGQTPL